MSTRAHVAFYERGEDVGGERILKKWNSLIYVHSDGYPTGLGVQVYRFCREFVKVRGFDVEYIAARMVQYLCNEYDSGLVNFSMPESYSMKKLTSKYAKGGRFPRHESPVLGFGICDSVHGDIEWFYAVSPSGLGVFRFDSPYGTEKPTVEQNMKLLAPLPGWIHDDADVNRKMVECENSTVFPASMYSDGGGTSRAIKR